MVNYWKIQVSVASWNASGRGAQLKGIFWRILLSLGLTEVVTIGSMVAVGLVTPTPQYLIPMSGMVIGTSMIVCGLYISQMNHDQLAELSALVYQRLDAASGSGVSEYFHS
ncbi:ABC transporter permease [Brevibacillus invocatus]|nr:ABC transporter permease [Brevibacillus invocatus]MCM3078519.1 ABC transporter permease [Brevibacillus invocatus]MCM3430903.1 ABC transporter permease [Brevibacillus invocatus]